MLGRHEFTTSNYANKEGQCSKYKFYGHTVLLYYCNYRLVIILVSTCYANLTCVCPCIVVIWEEETN